MGRFTWCSRRWFREASIKSRQSAIAAVKPGSSWDSPPATRCSTTGTGPSSSSSSIAGPEKDFHQDGDEATVTLHEKGDKHRRIGLHFAAAEAIAAYIGKAELTKGPLFRARLNSRSQKLGLAPIGAVTMYNLVQGYLSRLPASLREEEVTDEDGTVKKVKRCIYTPHSLQATTATLLLDAGVDIIKVKELLGHRHVTTTQIYDKRRRSLKEGASHDVPI